jgi:hypothetical protein
MRYYIVAHTNGNVDDPIVMKHTHLATPEGYKTAYDEAVLEHGFIIEAFYPEGDYQEKKVEE